MRWLAILSVLLLPACATSPAPTLPTGAALAQSHRASGAVRHLQSDLGQVFGAPIMARGIWAVDIKSIDTGEQIYQLNRDRLMMPASNLKIVTLAAAAEALGWDYRFPTSLETSAPIEAGVLKGDLIIRGGGDPSINSRDKRAGLVLDDWASALRGAGIQRIEGRIIGSDQLFDDEGVGPGWAWDYLQFGYAAPVGALQFNEDVATLTIRPAAQAGEPAHVALTAGAGLTVVNRIATGAAGSAPTVDYRRRLDQPILEVSGSIAADAAPIERSVAVVNPTLFFAQSVKDGLISRGMDVSGAAADFDDVAAEMLGQAAQLRPIVTTQSPPLREIAVVLMKASQNLYAETLLKAVGAARGGLGTFEGGLSAVRGALASWGVPDDAYVAADGSGLSRYNYVTAATITTILEREYKDERNRDAFLATLPVAGKDGTMAARLQRTRAAGNALAKTGSISNVRSVSGYVRSRDGEMLVFSIIANDFVIPAATVNWIADLAIEHLANFTRKR
jgi:D-alanyl-D-alanine carboxypeptidase/D-alanyl-D-alanine-endopeptidase (penicillin-binding protein 4)